MAKKHEPVRLGKTDIIAAIADKTGYAKKDIAAVISAEQEIIGENMKMGNEVVFVGFGSFKVQKVDARKGRNPQTNETITIPAHKKIKFTPGKLLTETVYKKN